MSGLFKKVDGALVPCSASGEKLLKSIREGDECLISKSQSRSPRQLRFYWSMLDKAIHNTEKFKSKHELHSYIKFMNGYFTTMVTESGVKFYREMSISLDSMPQEEFDEYLEKAKKIVCDILGVDINDLNREIEL